ncbi:hypothetical protein OTU49_006725, partial [Cherax quadricarinatus]
GYACKITSLLGPSSSLATLDASVIIEAVVVGRGQQGEVRSGQVTVPFHPSPVLDTYEVKLTNEEPSVTAFFQGTSAVLDKLEVLACSVNGIEVSLGYMKDNKKPLIISSKESLWSSELSQSKFSVSVNSPLTKNIIEVMVELELVGDGTCAVPRVDLGFFSLIVAVIANYDQFLVSFGCLFLIVASILVGYHALFGPGYKQTQQKGVFANSPAPPPTMSSFSPAVSSSPGSGGNDSATKRHGYTSPSPQRIKLWSVNTDPIYGAPPYRRGAYEGSPTYGVTPK